MTDYEKIPPGPANRRKRRWILITVIAVLAPVLYVLSLGPVAWTYKRYPPSQTVIETMGAPIEFVYERGLFKFLGIGEALDSYMEWWREQGEKK